MVVAGANDGCKSQEWVSPSGLQSVDIYFDWIYRMDNQLSSVSDKKK